MKTFVKRIMGPVYPVLVKAKSGDIVTRPLSVMGIPAYRRIRRDNRESLSIDIEKRCGMGAVITKALRFYNYGKQQGLDVSIISTNPLYASHRGTDFLSEYFERSAIKPGKSLRGRAYDWASWQVVDAHMPLTTAARLFAENFHPNARVRQTVANILGDRTAFDLSVHYRGTDKVLESGQVGEETIFPTIDQVVRRFCRPVDIFLATDDAAFDASIRKRYPDCRFTSYNLGSVDPDIARHFSAMSPDDKAMEAIVNIFLIASAPICVRTSSYLSAISKIVNPAMTTHTVNMTLKGSKLFPEREIIDAERDSKN